MILLVMFLASASTPVHADDLPSASAFAVEMDNAPDWVIQGAYYANPASNKLILFIGGGSLAIKDGTIWYALIGSPDTGLPPNMLVRFQRLGFNVATVLFGRFLFWNTMQDGNLVSWNTLEINAILAYLATEYHAPTTVDLIGFSAGGTVVAAYLLAEGKRTVDYAVILDSPLETFNSASLRVPTLLVYGLKDTTAPVNQSTQAWLANAPPYMAGLETYEYGHNPWSVDTSTAITIRIEARMLAHLDGFPLPEYPSTMIVLAIVLTLCLVVIKREDKKAIYRLKQHT